MKKITAHRAFQPVAMLLIILLILGVLDRYTAFNVVPRWVVYRTYSAENFPVSFEFPRNWSISKEEPNEVAVEFNKGAFTNARGVSITLLDPVAYLNGMETIQQRLYENYRVNEEAWLNTTKFELQEGRISSYEIIVDENGELVEDKEQNRTNYLRPLHSPRSITYKQQGFEWHYIRAVSRTGTIFFAHYFVKMEAVTEIDGEVVNVNVGCFDGDLANCERILWRTVRSVEYKP